MVAGLAACGALLWTWPAARDGLARYWEQQVMGTLSGSRGGDATVLDFAVNLLEALLPALVFVAIVVTVGWRRSGRPLPAAPRARTALWFLLLGLAGTLPLGLSPRQSLFYGVPAFPCFALALALAAAPALGGLIAGLRPGGRAHRIWRGAAVVLCGLVLIWSAIHVGTYNRDARLRADVKLMVAHLDAAAVDSGPVRVVAVCRDLGKNWALHSALRRYGRISPDRKRGDHPFLVARQGCEEPDPTRWLRVPLETVEFHLYGRTPAP
jgi:hypothetical protein